MDHFLYRDGALFAEDVPISEIAAAVGTPFYVYSTATLLRHFRLFDEALEGTDHLVCFAMKAASNQAILKTLAQAGAGMLATVGPEGTDDSPRGDDGPVVQELDPGTLALPDWRGNNRLDSLRNIVRDGRVSLMFLVPGSNNVVRVNGTARLTADPDLRARFEKKGKLPATVIVISIGEIYSQCARAMLRAGTWSGADESAGLPTMGDILAEQTAGEEGGAGYDKSWNARAAETMPITMSLTPSAPPRLMICSIAGIRLSPPSRPNRLVPVYLTCRNFSKPSASTILLRIALRPSRVKRISLS